MTGAIYCRLSKEDEDKHLESESIQNQRSLLIKYAMERGWDVYDIYSDDDYSGADRDRPDFNRLIEDAKQRKFNVVLVKTQSRFTRDMELVEKYIHGLFPIWSIRFVAVVDNADTNIKGNKKARQINGLVNEWYIEDLSENIRTVFNYKRKEGQYIGSFPLYGYQKDPKDKHKLIIDPEAADVVRKIFYLLLAGNGKQHIAHILNQENIPNPTAYKQSKGFNYVNSSQINDFGLWNRTTVGRILREQMYAGDMVQGKRMKVSYKSKQLIALPKSEWIIVPNMHEPIIDKDTFNRVQQLLDSHTRSSGLGEVYSLAGKVKCMDCGSILTKMSTRYKETRRSYLRCKLYLTDHRLCSNHSIRLDDLENQVLELLKVHINHYYDKSSIAGLNTDEPTQCKRQSMERELKKIALEVESRSKAIRDLYLDKSQGLIDQAQFVDLNQCYLDERAALMKKADFMTSRLKDLEDQTQDSNNIQKKLARWLKFNNLSRELVADFIDSVEVGVRDPQTGVQPIKINWLF